MKMQGGNRYKFISSWVWAFLPDDVLGPLEFRSHPWFIEIVEKVLKRFDPSRRNDKLSSDIVGEDSANQLMRDFCPRCKADLENYPTPPMQQ